MKMEGLRERERERERFLLFSGNWTSAGLQATLVLCCKIASLQQTQPDYKNILFVFSFFFVPRASLVIFTAPTISLSMKIK